MPLDEKKPFSLSNMQLFLRYPGLVFGVFKDGKTGGMRALFNLVRRMLSQTDLVEIENCLHASLYRRDLICPNSLRSLNGSANLWSIIIYYLCRITKPEIVVETGVLSGRSTTLVLQALRDNNRGFLYSIDIGIPNHSYKTNAGIHTDKYEKEELAWLVPEELKKKWQLLIGNSREVLPTLLSRLQKLDLFLHDSEHTYETMTFEFNLAWGYLSKGCYLIADDMNWNEAWNDFIRKVGEYGRVNTIMETLGIVQKW
jgi:hypothetical protein